MKQQTKGGALHRLWQALPWLWMAAAYLFDLWYQLVPGKWIVDSDLASEMILSDLLNKEGSIISHNWFYSTELKVVNLQWFYRLGLLLFPDDWHLARAFGMAVTLALYAACMLFFVKCARLGRPGLWMVGTLLWPFGQHYLVYAIYGGYYLVYTFFICLCWRWCCAASTPTKTLRTAMARGLHRYGYRGHERRQAAHGVPRAALHCRGGPAGACTARQRHVRLENGPAALPPSGATVCGVACHGGGRRGGVFHQQQRHVAAV